MAVSAADLLRVLHDEVFPAWAAQHPGLPRRDQLAGLLGALALRMAAARALDAEGASLPPVLRPAGIPLHHLPGDPDLSGAGQGLLGDLYTALSDDRRGRGSYYTPPALAAEVAHLTLAPLLTAESAPPRVLDPAMGAGAFLIAAAGQIAAHLRAADPTLSEPRARWRACASLHGIDRDPLAAALAAVSLWLWAALPGTAPGDLRGQLIAADALLDDAALAELAPPFDAVLGNPPFASVFTRRADPAMTEALRARYHSAAGAFDLAAPFVERALLLCREGGRCGLVLPNKLLSADHARVLRAWVAGAASVEQITDHTESGLFDAGVYPVTVIFTRGAPPPEAGLALYRGRVDGAPVLIRHGTQADLRETPGGWAPLLYPEWEALRRCLEGTIPLGEVADLSAGLTVDEAYSLRDRVFDAPAGLLPLNACRLLTSGLIHRYETAWGREPAHYLKRRFTRPAIAESVLPPRRCEQARAAKIVIAGLGREPRACSDPGLSLASVSTVIITGSIWPLPALCALLNAGPVARLYRALFGGLALAGGYLRFGRRELAALPVPALSPDDPALEELSALGTRRVQESAADEQRRLEARINALVRALYGLPMTDDRLLG